GHDKESLWRAADAAAAEMGLRSATGRAAAGLGDAWAGEPVWADRSGAFGAGPEDIDPGDLIDPDADAVGSTDLPAGPQGHEGSLASVSQPMLGARQAAGLRRGHAGGCLASAWAFLRELHAEPPVKTLWTFNAVEFNATITGRAEQLEMEAQARLRRAGLVSARSWRRSARHLAETAKVPPSIRAFAWECALVPGRDPQPRAQCLAAPAAAGHALARPDASDTFEGSRHLNRAALH
ncbi:unnamed protein product, partial [Prorocentrum cordatum]